MIIGIASDHHGVEKRKAITQYLEKKGHKVIDYSSEGVGMVDYPVYAFKLAISIVNKDVDTGIILCRTGIGTSIAANKVKGIRCAKVDNAKEAFYTRNDNDANMMALSDLMNFIRMKDIIDIFLTTPFSNIERHIRRNKMIDEYDN